MKTIWLLFLCLVFTASLNAQTYRVISRNALNIRDSATIHSKVVGQLLTQDTVHVIRMEKQWAQINYNGSPAYINNRYIVPFHRKSKKSAKEFFQDIQNIFQEGPNKYLPLLIILTFFLTTWGRQMFSGQNTARMYIGMIGLVAISGMELFYFIVYNTGQPWFCNLQIIGWVWTVINFFLYGFVLIWQIKTSFGVIQEICNGRAYNLKTGIYSYPIAFGLMLVFYWTNIDMNEYIAWGLVIAQTVQVVLNFYLIRHWKKALLISTLFLLTTIAVIVSSFYFLGMLLIVTIALLILSFAGNIMETNSRTIYLSD